MDTYEISFQLILNAGNAKSKALMAIEFAREYKFDEAQNLLTEAQSDLHLAHKSQTTLIQTEAQGNKTEFTILLVHAQDHLSMAMTTFDTAQEFFYLYKKFQKLEKNERM